MKIIKLTAEKIKRIRAVIIERKGNLTEIAGRNAQGKTSVLDSIWWALAGKGVIQDKPVREGEKEGFVELELSEGYKVRRDIKADRTTKLKVWREGAEQKAPQEILDKLRGDLSFDALEFARSRDRKSILLRVVGLTSELERLDREYQALYAQRRDIGRDMTNLKGELAGIPASPPETPETEISLAALSDKLSNALEDDTLFTQNRNMLEQTCRKIAALQRELAFLTETRADLECWLKEKVRPDVAGIREEMARADATNRVIRQAKHRSEVAKRFAVVSREYQDLTDRLAGLQSEKASALANARFPVEGLGISDGDVTYQGIPFEQCGSAEQLRISVGIAMALNPTLRFIRITDASLLDGDSLAAIQEMAEQNDCDVWYETVDPKTPSAVIIEDGMVVHSEQPQPTQKRFDAGD